MVVVGTFGDSAIEVLVKPWSSLGDFGDASAEIKLAVLEAFRAHNIDIPFPQREVRMVNAGALNP